MKLSLLLFIGAVFCSSILRADTVYPVYANYAGTNYGSGSALSISQAVAVPFVTPATGVEGFAYALSDIEFVAFVSDPSANPVTVALYDTSAGFPGTALESFGPNLATQAGVVTVTSSTHPIIVSGQEYWIVVSDPLSFDVTWIADGNGATNPASFSTLNGWVSLGDGYSQGAVQVNATLVPFTAPEPGTFVAFGSGLSTMILLTRRRRRRERISAGQRPNTAYFLMDHF